MQEEFDNQIALGGELGFKVDEAVNFFLVLFLELLAVLEINAAVPAAVKDRNIAAQRHIQPVAAHSGIALFLVGRLGHGIHLEAAGVERTDQAAHHGAFARRAPALKDDDGGNARRFHFALQFAQTRFQFFLRAGHGFFVFLDTFVKYIKHKHYFLRNSWSCRATRLCFYYKVPDRYIQHIFVNFIGFLIYFIGFPKKLQKAIDKMKKTIIIIKVACGDRTERHKMKYCGIV